jgi:hypothetical protein
MTTKEEVEKSPIFRIIRRGLMVKYPWIKNVYIDNDEDVEKYSSMMFFNVDIDAPQMFESVGATPEKWMDPTMIRKVWRRDYYDSVYLSSFGSSEDRDKLKGLQDDLDADIKRIQKSQAVPSEYRDQFNKAFGASTFRWNFPPPEEEQPSPIVTT